MVGHSGGAALHLLCSAPGQWAEFWPEFMALYCAGDSIVLLGEAKIGFEDTRLASLKVVGCFDPIWCPAEMSSDEIAHMILNASQVLTWR